MAKLKRDERQCPFCAETIKAAAIRCRFCQADLTQAERTEPVAEPGEPVTGPAEPVAEPAESVTIDDLMEDVDLADLPEEIQKEASPLRHLTVILATLIAVAAIGVGVAWWQAEDESVVSAPSGTLVGDEARANVIVAAADLTQRALSYDYRTLATDMDTARARMTPSFRKEYDDTMVQVKANTLKNKITLQAVVVSSSVIVATEHKARLLLFLNQTTSAKTTKNQQLDRNSLVVTLVRGKGDWKLDKLTALG